MAPTITRTAIEAVRADIDRVTTRRNAREIAKRALRSRNPSVLKRGHLIMDFLEDEADAQHNAWTATEEDFAYWAECQGMWIREIRAEAGALEGLLDWRVS